MLGREGLRKGRDIGKVWGILGSQLVFLVSAK